MVKLGDIFELRLFDRTLLSFSFGDFERYASMMVFDNGRSLFFNLGFAQVGSLEQEANFALPSWPQVTFEEQAARLIGPVQKSQLERLASFGFANSEEKPFPEDYLRELGSFIRRRAERLAELPCVSREGLAARAGIAAG